MHWRRTGRCLLLAAESRGWKKFDSPMETAKNVMEKLESEQRTARMPVGGKRYTKTLRNSAEPGSQRRRSHNADLHRLSTGDRKRIGIEE